jgi:hypothetical protein
VVHSHYKNPNTSADVISIQTLLHFAFILGVFDIIHNNLTHLCVFFSSCWLLNMTVSGIQARWHEEDACELTTDWGTLSPEALSQEQMQESDPGLVKPSYTMSFCCAFSGYSINNVDDLPSAGHAISQKRSCILQDISVEVGTLNTTHCWRVESSWQWVHPKNRSLHSWVLWPHRRNGCFVVWQTQWGHFIPAGNTRPRV